MEIGSVIEFDNWEMYKNIENEKLFYLPFMKNNKYKTVMYQSGRNAIEILMKYFIEKLNINKILLPDYICTTVVEAVSRAKMQYQLYSVNRNFECDIMQIENEINKGINCIYIVQYFGKKLPIQMIQAINAWKNKGIIIVEDITMALFSSDYTSVGFGNYVLGSIRKWLPIPDGGFISTKEKGLPNEQSIGNISKYTYYYTLVQTMKREYIEEDLSDVGLKENYMNFYKMSIEELFSDYKIYPISQISKNYLFNYDMNKVISKRIRNYDYLCNKIYGLSGIKVKIRREEGMVPFGMLIESTNRDNLLKYLIDNNIYCNVHWRLDERKQNSDIKYLSDSVITIPCDQRYKEEEMDYIANVLEHWEKR